jgi:Peptidase family M28
VIIVALLSTLLDVLTGRSLGRRLTREHASQNVVSPAPAGSPPVSLIITANYDSGRMGLAYRPFLRRPAARLRALAGPPAPGWLGWLAILCLWVLATAILRNAGKSGTALSVAQFVPTAALVIGLALLLELAGSTFGPGAGDNASGAAVAVALARALDVAPPRRLGVAVVLQGAGDGAMLGLTHHLRAHRVRAADTIVLGLAACGGGSPRYWTSDGPALPLRFAPRLAEMAQTAGAAHDAQLSAHRGRGASPAYPARRTRLPAITIGCLDGLGLPPRSHLPEDLPAAIDGGATDRLLGLALTLIDAIDAALPAAPADVSETLPDAAK